MSTNRVPDIDFLGTIHEGIPVLDEAMLNACVRFYTEVLGVRVLPRPNLPVPGAWLGDEGSGIQFHLIVSAKDYAPGAKAAISATGRHTALKVRDLGALRARLHALAVPYEERTGLVASDQVFVKDPVGHTWEFQEEK